MKQLKWNLCIALFMAFVACGMWNTPEAAAASQNTPQTHISESSKGAIFAAKDDNPSPSPKPGPRDGGADG